MEAFLDVKDLSFFSRNKNTIFWIVTIIAPLLIMLTPTGEVFTPDLRLFVAITVCAILIFAFETLPQLIPSILLPLGYLLTDLAPAQAVFGPWSTFIPWMIMGGILMANVLENIGLLRRVAYWCIIKIGGTYNRILYGIMFAGIVLNLLVPANAIIPLAAFTFGICKALDLKKSKATAGIMLAGAMAALMPVFFFYNPNFAVITGAASPVYKTSMTWLQYFYHNIPGIAWAFFTIFLLTKLFKPEQVIDAKDYINEEYRKLGKMTLPEKKGVFVTILLLAFLLTAQYHKIAIGWGFALAGCLMYLPGINIGTEEDIKRINFPLLFFCTACMAIGSVSNILGFGKILTATIMPMMTAGGVTVTLTLVWLLCVMSNFLMTPLAIWAAFSAPLAAIAINLGVDPRTFFYTIFQATDQLLLPYEYILVLIFFSFGLIRVSDFVKFFGLKMIFNILFIVAVMVPYWKLIGLL